MASRIFFGHRTAGGAIATRSVEEALLLTDASARVSLRARRQDDALSLVDVSDAARYRWRLIESTLAMSEDYTALVVAAGIVYTQTAEDHLAVSDAPLPWLARRRSCRRRPATLQPSSPSPARQHALPLRRG